MVLYFLSVIIIIVLLLSYFKIAKIFKIVDTPNERSSHTYITIRGGGIVFVISALLWFVLYGFNQPWFILAIFLIAGVSFLDDIFTLSSKIRFITHILAVTILFWQVQVFGLNWYVIILAYIFTLGWINAFNFMDGINGITGIYSLVALSSFAWLNHSVEFVSQQLIVILIFSVIIFLFFNARKKAKTFAGDVGSVSMAFILSWFMISLIMKTGNLEYILFFTVYGIDSVITILFRLQRKENIFEAHRTHLYQYLSNELKWPHVSVSLIYGVSQLIINIAVIWLIFNNAISWILLAGILIFLSAIYLIIRGKVKKAIPAF